MLARRLLFPAVAAVAVLGAAAPAVAAADCPKGYRCTTVEVPLDRSGATPGTLKLPVIAERGRQPLLIVLAGGPGQGAASIGDFLIETFEQIAPGHRIAVFDQRGTGPNALRCPAMQRAALTDLTVPPRGSVEACARALGDARAFYTTTESVADLDAVRAALGAEKLSLSGTSYGTYVAERYALAHPDRVSRLVLDSVVPQENVDPFFAASMRRLAVVLRQACAGGGCPATKDPIRAVRRLVARVERTPIPVKVELGKRTLRTEIDGPAVYDLSISLASFFQGNIPDLPRAAAKATAGKPAALRTLYRAVRERQLGGARELSWGLHTATLCEDTATFPWGTAAAPSAGRRAAVTAAADALPERHFGVFGRSTAAGNGMLVTCERWPSIAVAPPPAPAPLPDVPVLLLNGTWDMSTPVEDARTEAVRAPQGRLVTVPRGGHSTLTSAPCARTAARRFLAGRPLGDPCRG